MRGNKEWLAECTVKSFTCASTFNFFLLVKKNVLLPIAKTAGKSDNIFDMF